MRALVVYESIFGNTEAIARAIGRGLERGVEVRVIEVAEAPAALDVDLLVVGGPTHAFTMSQATSRMDARRRAAEAHVAVRSRGDGIREWLAALSVHLSAGNGGAHRCAATFDTVVDTKWLPTGSAARKAAVVLRRLGFFELAAPKHFRVRNTAGPLVDGELARAEQWGADLASRLVDSHQQGTFGAVALQR